MRFMLKLIRKICFIYNNFVIYINTYFGKDNTRLVIISSTEISRQIQGQINEAEKKLDEKILEAKKGYEKKKEFEKLSRMISSENRSQVDFKKATLQELLNNVHHHVKEERSSVEQFFHIMENKFFSKLSKYTNDFVEKDGRKSITELPTKALQMHVRKSPLDHKNKENEKAGGKSPAAEEKDLDLSYVSAKVVSNEVRKKKERNFFGYNKEMSQDLQNLRLRNNDLNILQLKLLKSKNQGTLNNGQLTEIYHHFKKKMYAYYLFFQHKAFLPFKSS
jgi:hypothetical protein